MTIQSKTMRAAFFRGQPRLTVEETAVPAPGRGEILLKVERAGICGSDLHVVHTPSDRVVILGHEFAGTVAELGAGVDRFKTGDSVCSLPSKGCGICGSCLTGDPTHCAAMKMIGLSMPGNGAFAEYVIVGAAETLRLPPGVDTALGALIEPLAVGLQMIEKLQWRPGEKLAILGAGPVGLAVALWARALGIGDIIVSDPVATRRELALKLGATAVCDPSREDLSDFCRREIGGAPDLVVECIGRPGSLDMATQLARTGGRVIIGGMHMEHEPTLRMIPFVKGLTITYSIMYEVRHFAYALRMLEQRRIDPRPMITHEVSLSELPDAMDALSKPNDCGKILVAPGRIY